MSVFDFLRNPALPRPEVSLDDARRFGAERYGLRGSVTELGSNQDRNFLFDEGDRLVLLKLSNPAFGAAELQAQNRAAEAAAAAGLRVPRCLASLTGAEIETADVGGATLSVRLLTFVDGEPLTGRAFGPGDAAALGRLSARVASALAGVEHPGAAQRTQWNLQLAGEVVDLLAGAVPDPARRSAVEQATAAALARLQPLRGRLRTQVIHGDLTDDNAILPDGVIDFGDVAESWTVAELAVTCIAALHHHLDVPLTVLDTIAAFHEVLPLTGEEQDALWPLVQLRAAVLVVSGEHQVALEAGNAYAAENRNQEWRAFQAAAALDADAMRALIRWRLGAWSAPFAVDPPARPLVDASAAGVLDLSTTAPALDSGAWLEPGIEERLAAEAGYSVTTWGEARLTRARPLSAQGVPTVALGIEVHGAEPGAVPAPTGGTVRHAGDAVVLEGESCDVWVTGLDGVAAEGPIEAGAALGRLASHPGSLTVQVSRLRGERPPFFVPPGQADVWRQVSPDPSALLARPVIEPAGITAETLLAERDASFAVVQEHYYAHPPRIERGWREHFVDTDGQSYLDMVNNVATVGHGHPRLVDAVARQWSLHNTNSRFHYAVVAELSRRLAELAPDPLDTVFLVNSGSEAVDLALRLATTATGRPTVLAMREAYHGWTIGSDAVSSSIGDNPRALETRPPWVRLVDAPHPLRGVDGAAALASLDAALAPGPPAAFIAEAVYGNAGGVLLPDGYLAGAYERVRAAGGLCIADEVQVGYGRLGSHFWGFEQQGAAPDILTVAKAMGNGHPLGAVITTRAIADAFAAEGSMFSSAGGSPVSCVVGLTVLDIMRDEGLVENARDVGGHLRERLLELGSRHPVIAAVHGMGLYLGVELMRDGEPAGALAAGICDAMLREGVILQPTGDHRNVLKIKPPMVITRESVDYFVARLDEVLATLGA